MYVKYESEIVRTKKEKNKNDYNHKTTIKSQQSQLQSPLSLPHFHFYGSFVDLPIMDLWDNNLSWNAWTCSETWCSVPLVGERVPRCICFPVVKACLHNLVKLIIIISNIPWEININTNTIKLNFKIPLRTGFILDGNERIKAILKKWNLRAVVCGYRSDYSSSMQQPFFAQGSKCKLQ